jgi:hypothetical protein
MHSGTLRHWSANSAGILRFMGQLEQVLRCAGRLTPVSNFDTCSREQRPTPILLRALDPAGQRSPRALENAPPPVEKKPAPKKALKPRLDFRPSTFGSGGNM